MAGNKGAVAIRMEYAKTSICFVTAHLAAGFANYEERNRDYRTINNGLRFQRNRSIEDHDAIIWLGDFNYRIGLSDDKARQLIEAGDLHTLYQNDQVSPEVFIPSLDWLDDRCTVESTDGRRKYVSLLLRVKNYFPANVQIQKRNRHLRYLVSSSVRC